MLGIATLAGGPAIHDAFAALARDARRGVTSGTLVSALRSALSRPCPASVTKKDLTTATGKAAPSACCTSAKRHAVVG
ncbi:hypothetical protein HPB50_022127 [Hyalomma asiaticum]|uniref:Uncharacterized protein n=1 Tax=Hyalomma asiaticum TaxID=266040 RepID=A0ACB7TPJ2_HYAAI|nr:hypothetical protein HPB50_022127 [Hyalomma asiaticum]